MVGRCWIVARGERTSRHSRVCVYYWCGRGQGRRKRKNVFHKLDMMGHKGFFENRVKTEEDTLIEGVTEKNTRTGFGKNRDATKESINNRRHRVWMGSKLCGTTFQKKNKGKDQL